jgi:hypothetical protein
MSELGTAMERIRAVLEEERLAMGDTLFGEFVELVGAEIDKLKDEVGPGVVVEDLDDE